MTLTIKSDEPITEEILLKVRGIFSESNCPNESLSKTFDNFNFYRNQVIQFGEGENFVEYINVRSK